MSSEDIINKLTMNYMVNKNLLRKLNNKINDTLELEHYVDQKREYKEQIRELFNQLLDSNNNSNNSHLEKSFTEFTKLCIQHLTKLTNEVEVTDCIVETEEKDEEKDEYEDINSNSDLDANSVTSNSDSVDMDNINDDDEYYDTSNYYGDNNIIYKEHITVRPKKTKYNTFMSTGVETITTQDNWYEKQNKINKLHVIIPRINTDDYDDDDEKKDI
jgi:hypothetical protein